MKRFDKEKIMNVFISYMQINVNEFETKTG